MKRNPKSFPYKTAKKWTPAEMEIFHEWLTSDKKGKYGKKILNLKEFTREYRQKRLGDMIEK